MSPDSDRPYKAAAPRRGTQDQAACCLGRSDPQAKVPQPTNDLIASVGLLRAPADRARHTSSAGNHPTLVTHVHYCMVERVRARACLGAHVSVCAFVRMDMHRVAVCWCAAAQRELDAGQAPSSIRLSDSAALSAFTCVSCSLCSSTCMHKTGRFGRSLGSRAGGYKRRESCAA